MGTLDQDFHRRLVKKIEETETDMMGSLRSGTLNIETYKSQTGYLRALDNVKEWCEDIESQIASGK